MELSLADLRLLIEAVGTLEAEYGERPATSELLERLRATRRRREEDD
jgi:hypothetical protein